MLLAQVPGDAIISNLGSANPATKFGLFADLGSLLLKSDILTLVFFFIGFLFFANLIMASFAFIFSEGNADKISKANTRIVNSLLGITIVFASFVIVRIVASVFYRSAPGIIPF